MLRVLLIALVFLVGMQTPAGSQGPPTAAPAPQSVQSSPIDGELPVGTVIDTSNWRQFREFMPDGMAKLFEGSYFWKMPAGASIRVGPTVSYPLPTSYLAATEKYSDQVRIVQLPDGGLTVSNYHGGIPFPHPQEPNRGWKVLTNLWFRYYPRLVAQTYGYTCGMDATRSVNCLALEYVTRRFAYNTDPGPSLDNTLKDIYFTNWFMVIEPEQEKYTTELTINYADPARHEESYIFLPALRRYQAISPSARCAATAGTDATPDDFFFGFDSNITQVKVDYLARRRILSLVGAALPHKAFPEGFEMPLGWPAPSMGEWQVRDVDEIAVSKLPGSGGARCYGRRIYYIDSQSYVPLWTENYDQQMHPMRYHGIFPNVIDVVGVGKVMASGSDAEAFWNFETDHASFTMEPALDGKHYIDQQVPAYYNDIPRYSSPSGLNLIMR